MKPDGDPAMPTSTTFDEPVDRTMSRSVATVHQNDTVWSVLEHFHLSGLRHMVVLDRADRCVGVLSDRLAADYIGCDRRELECIRVRDVMFDRRTSVISGTSLRDAAREMLRHAAGALAVADRDGRVLGVVTGADVMRRFLADESARRS